MTLYTYLGETSRVPVDRGGLRAEWDGLGSLSANIAIGELVQSRGRLHRGRRGKGACRTGNGRNNQEELGHGQQLLPCTRM